MPKTVPLRQCIGCREQKPKTELIRVVRSPEGELSIDLRGRVPGRGAYLCRRQRVSEARGQIARARARSDRPRTGGRCGRGSRRRLEAERWIQQRSISVSPGRAGCSPIGEEGSGTAIAAGKGRLLMLAADASPNAQKRAAGFLYGHRAPLQTLPWTQGGAFRHAGQARMQHGSASPICALAARFAAALAEELPGWKETAELLAQREDKLQAAEGRAP